MSIRNKRGAPMGKRINSATNKTTNQEGLALPLHCPETTSNIDTKIPETKQEEVIEPPKFVKARWRSYTIEYSHKETDSEELLGQADYQNGKIFISDRICDDEKKATLLHELFHTVLYDIGSDYNFTAKQIEHLCQIFSSSVIDLVRENPEIVKWFQNTTNKPPEPEPECKEEKKQKKAKSERSAKDRRSSQRQTKDRRRKGK